jgi:hypothetical protein
MKCLEQIYANGNQLKNDRLIEFGHKKSCSKLSSSKKKKIILYYFFPFISSNSTSKIRVELGAIFGPAGLSP